MAKLFLDVRGPKAQRDGGMSIQAPVAGCCPRCATLLCIDAAGALGCLSCGYEWYADGFEGHPSVQSSLPSSEMPKPVMRPNRRPCRDCGVLVNSWAKFPRCKPCRSDKVDERSREGATHPCAVCGAPTSGRRCRLCFKAKLFYGG